MVRYFCNSTDPGGAGTNWSAGAECPTLRVDVPDESGAWPEGRVQLLSGGVGGRVHLRVLPFGGNPKRDLVVVFLQGYELRLIGHDNPLMPHAAARVYAQGTSSSERAAGIVIAAELGDGEALVIKEFPSARLGDPIVWVFDRAGARKITEGEAVAMLCPSKIVEL